MNSQPYSVSVILSVYNREKTLKRSINSLLLQTFSDWELIAIDDGSSDDSYKILKYYENQYDNIKVYNQSNSKLAYSRNRGIRLSSGNFITFLDSDDEYKPEHLLLRVNYMLTHSLVDFIHGGVKIVGDEYVRDKDNPYCFIHLSECTIGATFFGKSSVFKELEGFRQNIYSEDSEFLKRVSEKYKVKKVNFS
ncbi:MAG TPA: glycosyltransferase family A protein, partial [Ignavibacteriaceae bacterium]|nr:glycosyltransferase family A protein [Ignavibacteriaceae bacterium]